MSNPTITNGLVTFTFADGDCETVVVKKNGNLDENPLPASDSNYAFVIDFNGVLKTITLSGFITEALTTRTDIGTTTTIEAQQDWLLALVNGSQTGYTFSSTYQTGKTVYCRNVQFTEKSGDPNRVSFVIDFVEGL
jgi:hypothetical protein